MTPSPKKRIPSPDLRTLFNEKYIPEIQNGNLQVTIVKDNHPSPLRSNQPYCTRSQLLEFRDKAGNVIVKAHQYLQKDGRIGGSGRPDPKYLLHDGVILIPDS